MTYVRYVHSFQDFCLDCNKMKWPSKSPDLNLIEWLWAILQKKVVESMPETKEDLIKALREEWWKIDQEVIRRLYNSMNECLENVLRGRAGSSFTKMGARKYILI